MAVDRSRSTPFGSTPWSAYTHYHCRHCKEPCINRFDSLRAKLTECRSCHQVADLDLAATAKSEERSESAPSHGGPSEHRSATPERSEGNPDVVRSGRGASRTLPYAATTINPSEHGGDSAQRGKPGERQ